MRQERIPKDCQNRSQTSKAPSQNPCGRLACELTLGARHTKNLHLILLSTIARKLDMDRPIGAGRF